MASSPSVKHLGMLLDSRLNFNEHVESKRSGVEYYITEGELFQY